MTSIFTDFAILIFFSYYAGYLILYAAILCVKIATAVHFVRYLQVSAKAVCNCNGIIQYYALRRSKIMIMRHFPSENISSAQFQRTYA